MIKSFGDKETEKIFNGILSKKLPQDIQSRGMSKLHLIHNATVLTQLETPPGNRLEALSGDRNGQHSIRINKQWRICFTWLDGDAIEVKIEDYH